MIRKFAQAVSVVLALVLGLPAASGEPREIGWDDLLPAPQGFDDPFTRLSSQQIGDLARIHLIESVYADQATEAEKAEAAALRQGLVAQGLDPDWLFEQRLVVMEQRQRAASAPNQALLGQMIRMPGYLLPLEMDGQKAVEFLLVPTVGACIHTPPPPPNQIIHVRFDDGFPVEGLYEPVWVVGQVRGESLVSALTLVDGQADVETSYTMRAVSVVSYW